MTSKCICVSPPQALVSESPESAQVTLAGAVIPARRHQKGRERAAAGSTFVNFGIHWIPERLCLTDVNNK